VKSIFTLLLIQKTRIIVRREGEKNAWHLKKIRTLVKNSPSLLAWRREIRKREKAGRCHVLLMAIGLLRQPI
jgi:hypothetical protein